MANTGTSKSQAQSVADEMEAKISHLVGCPAERQETYETRSPRGFVIIARCIDCGAFFAGKPSEEPVLS